MFYDRFLTLCKNAGRHASPTLGELGLSNGSLTRWRNGTLPNGETLIAIADYFDCSVDYLLGRTDDPNIAIKKIPSERGEIILGVDKAHKDDDIDANELLAALDRFEGMTKDEVVALMRQIAREEAKKEMDERSK